LALIGELDLMPKLFGKVLLPIAVLAELTHPRAPLAVRDWIAHLPSWVEICDDPQSPLDPDLLGLDDGERYAISLALMRNADLLLIDDREGVAVASARGIRVTGTLGVLDLAAERGFVNFASAMEQLQRTNFRQPSKLVQRLLDKHGGQG
jgi:predicted nucleic acid-binding protein